MTPLQKIRRQRKALEDREVRELLKRLVDEEKLERQFPCHNPAEIYYTLRLAATEPPEFFQAFSPGRFQKTVNRLNNRFIAAERQRAALRRKKEPNDVN